MTGLDDGRAEVRSGTMALRFLKALDLLAVIHPIHTRDPRKTTATWRVLVAHEFAALIRQVLADPQEPALMNRRQGDYVILGRSAPTSRSLISSGPMDQMTAGSRGLDID